MTAPGPVHERSLVVGGVPTRALSVAGSGPVVLLVHGFTDSADTWRGVLAGLSARGRAAVAVDLPGHGRAATLPSSDGLDGHDDFLRAAIDTVDDGSGVVLVGNSLGALLALRAAERDDRAVAGVLALAPPGSSVLLALRTLPRVWPMLRRVLQYAPVPGGLLQFGAGHAFAVGVAGGRLDPMMRRAYAQHLDRDRLLELLSGSAETMAEITDPDTSTLLRFRVPVTLWWGSADRVCQVRGAVRFGTETRVVITPGAPHSPQLRTPDLVLDQLAAHEAYAVSSR